MNNHNLSCAGTHGASLLEVMVALVVMSIGLLGLASLQLVGMRANSNSEDRTQALTIANDLAERMRANHTAVADGAYVGVDFSNVNCSAMPVNMCEDRNTAAQDCRPGQMAGFDAITAWCNTGRLLHQGSLAIRCTDNKGNAENCVSTPYRTLQVNWVDQFEGGSENRSYSMTFRP